MKKPTIYLKNEKELRIFMLPLRQKILNSMQVEGSPMTAKQIADRLAITPSSAKHHLLKLEEIGLVEFDHSKLINGITARYYIPTGATVSIGQGEKNVLKNERNAFTKNMVAEAYEGYTRVVDKYSDSKDEDFLGDIISGVVHLSDKQAIKLHRTIIDFMEANDKAGENTKAWSFAIIGFRSDLA
jgi:DNA-binding transcriptional ArsR family regulator